MSDRSRQQAAIVLYAFAGGFADAASYLLYNTFTGHVTGNLVFLALSLVDRSWTQAAARGLAIAGFLVCTGLGFRLARARRSALWLFCLQAALLLPAGFGNLYGATPALLGIAALCCSLGLQNGVVTSSLGVSVHSTFISGDVTSLIKLGSKPVPPGSADRGAHRQSARVLQLLLAAFAAGAFTAACLSKGFLRWEVLLLLIPLGAAAAVQAAPRAAAAVDQR